MNIEEAIGMLNGMAAHADWAEEWMPKYEITDSNIHSIVQKEIGIVFTKVLEDAGVYKRTEEGKAAFKRFIESLKKGPLHFCEMVLRKNIQFSQNSPFSIYT